MALAIGIAHHNSIPLDDTTVAIAIAATLAALTTVVAAHLGALPRASPTSSSIAKR